MKNGSMWVRSTMPHGTTVFRRTSAWMRGPMRDAFLREHDIKSSLILVPSLTTLP